MKTIYTCVSKRIALYATTLLVAGSFLWVQSAVAQMAPGPFTLLPIENTAFRAVVVGDNIVALGWQTVTENNSNQFIVEKSTDRNTWYMVAAIKAAGHSSSVKTYDAMDNNAFTGISYYRLRQTDLDGNATYSDIKMIKIDDGKNSVLLYPNPAATLLNVKASADEIKNIRFISSAGQDMTGLVKKTAGNGTTVLMDVYSLPAGTYFVKTTTVTSKIVKQ